MSETTEERWRAMNLRHPSTHFKPGMWKPLPLKIKLMSLLVWRLCQISDWYKKRKGL